VTPSPTAAISLGKWPLIDAARPLLLAVVIMSAAELESLFRLYRHHVLRRASAILGDGEAAKDVMQEVFTRALNARAELPTAATSMGWLYRITTNLCLTGLRDGKRRKRLLDRSAPRRRLASDPIADNVLTVRALLRDVPDELRRIAIYYFVDEMSQDEISALTGIPRRTVSYRIEQFLSHTQGIVTREANC
jgi:RNA polymerase sigma-70 factor, ECF subfamily